MMQINLMLMKLFMMEINEVKKMAEKELDIGKLCTKGKNLFTQRNRKIIKTNPLSKVESTTFGADKHLALLVKQKEDAEDNIEAYMKSVLKETRMPEDKPVTIFTVLEDCLNALEAHEGLYVYDQDGPHTSEALLINNSELIEKIKTVI